VNDAVDEVRVTHIGGPTVLIEAAGWRILSDPTFDPPGRTYAFALGTSSRKLAGPALAADDLGPIDVVLVSHDHHADNLDDAGRALLATADHVVTNTAAAARLGGGAVGIDAGEITTLAAPGRPDLRITATPCRHGPPLSRRIVGLVVGFALRWRDGDRDDLWITGDTVAYPAVRRAAEAMDVGIAVVHLGEVRFSISGPLRYTMTAAEGLELGRIAGADTIIPVHYEGWSHFHQGRAGIDHALAASDPEVRRRVQILRLGESTAVR
jgi:L-ascorbate metabolism protein UlaG (beta-lactamase superfamily)